MRAGDYARCEQALDCLARDDGLTSADRLIQAWVFKARARYEEAIQVLGRISPTDPLAPTALLTAGVIELRRDRSRRAEAALRAALAIDPAFAPARQELARLYGREQRLADLNEQFRALARQGTLDFSLLHFWCLTRNASWNAAQDIAALRRAVAADAEDRPSRIALAEGLRTAGRTGEAEAVLASVPDLDADARVVRVRLALDRGDPERAAELANGGPREHAGLARLRGQFALVRGDAELAVRHLHMAYQLEPDDRQTLFSLATAYRRAGAVEAAQPLLDAMRRFDVLHDLVARLEDPKLANDGEFLRRVGAATEALGRRTEASAWYRLAIASNPSDSQAQQALFRLGQSPVDQRPAEPTSPGSAK